MTLRQQLAKAIDSDLTLWHRQTCGAWSFRPIQSNGRPGYDIFRKGERTRERGWIRQTPSGCYSLCIWTNGIGHTDACHTLTDAMNCALEFLNYGPRYKGQDGVQPGI
jgi:hypothetical protein